MDQRTRVTVTWTPKSVVFDDVTFTWWSTVDQETVVETSDGRGNWYVSERKHEDILRASKDYPADMIMPSYTSDRTSPGGVNIKQADYLQNLNTLEGLESTVTFNGNSASQIINHDGQFVIATPSGGKARSVILDFNSPSYDVFDDQRRYLTTITNGAVIDGATANAMLHTNAYDVTKEYMVTTCNPVSWMDGTKSRNDIPVSYSVNFFKNNSGAYAPRTNVQVMLEEYNIEKVPEGPTQDDWYIPSSFEVHNASPGDVSVNRQVNFTIGFANPSFFVGSVIESVKHRDEYKPERSKVTAEQQKGADIDSLRGVLDVVNVVLDPVGFFVSSIVSGSHGWLASIFT